jgi:hypothetical protein
MTDAQLLEFGKAARYTCSPNANMGKAPQDLFVIQLNEVRGMAAKEFEKASLRVESLIPFILEFGNSKEQKCLNVNTRSFRKTTPTHYREN